MSGSTATTYSNLADSYLDHSPTFAPMSSARPHRPDVTLSSKSPRKLDSSISRCTPLFLRHMSRRRTYTPQPQAHAFDAVVSLWGVDLVSYIRSKRLRLFGCTRCLECLRSGMRCHVFLLSTNLLIASSPLLFPQFVTPTTPSLEFFFASPAPLYLERQSPYFSACRVFLSLWASALETPHGLADRFLSRTFP